MKHIRNLLSISQVLRRVFLPPIETTRTQFPRPNLLQTRLIFPTRTQLRLGSSSTKKDDGPKQVIDEQIRANYVRVVNAEGRLEPPERLKNVLASIPRPENFLLQVVPGDLEAPPICKVINRRDQNQKERTKAKEMAARKRSEPKQVELNWSIDNHDLSHRLKQMSGFLGKGRKVDIVLKKKRGKRVASKEEIEHVMDSVKEAIEAADAVEHKPMDGQPGRELWMFVKRRGT